MASSTRKALEELNQIQDLSQRIAHAKKIAELSHARNNVQVPTPPSSPSSLSSPEVSDSPAVAVPRKVKRTGPYKKRGSFVGNFSSSQSSASGSASVEFVQNDGSASPSNRGGSRR
jgi:hypothetical protein